MNTQNLLAGLLLLLFTTTNAQNIAITTAELPVQAQTFLKQHFEKNTVHYVTKEIGNRKTDYEVRLTDHTEIEFTEKGEWKEVDGNKKAIPTTFIPKSILTYLKTNYPHESITKIEKGYSDIELKLSNHLKLEFDLKGNFLRIDD